MQKGPAFILIIGVLVLVFVASKAYYSGKPQSSQPTMSSQTSATVSPTATPTPIALMVKDRGIIWKTYTNDKYTFQYPSTWTLLEGDEARLTFTENKKEYKFSVETGGRDGPEADNILNQQNEINGKKFNRRTWVENNKPFLISIIPEEKGFNLFNHIEISVPAENPEKYLDIFNLIFASFIFKK